MPDWVEIQKVLKQELSAAKRRLGAIPGEELKKVSPGLKQSNEMNCRRLMRMIRYVDHVAISRTLKERHRSDAAIKALGLKDFHLFGVNDIKLDADNKED